MNQPPLNVAYNNIPNGSNQGDMTMIFHPGQFPRFEKPIKLNKNAFLGMGIVQTIIGVVCFVLNVADIVIWGDSIVGYGIWGGVLFFISGLLAILIGKIRVRKSLINATMVMNIISAAITIPVLSLGIAYALTQRVYHGNYYGSYSIYYDQNIVGITSTIAILALIEAVISITCSAFCCNAYCCCSSHDNVVVVHGYPNNISYSNVSGLEAPVMIPPPFPQQTLLSQNNGVQSSNPPPYNPSKNIAFYDSREKY